jgi:hypothetical protein
MIVSSLRTRRGRRAPSRATDRSVPPRPGAARRSPSIQVRYHSSRFSSAQIDVPPVGGAGAVGVEQLLDHRGIHHAPLARAAIEEDVARRRRARRRASSARTAREPHLRPREDLARQQVAGRRAQQALGRKPAQLGRRGQLRGELHELVIEERHAALDGRRHAHLVLLHQELDQIGLQVGVQDAIEERRPWRGGVEPRPRRGVRVAAGRERAGREQAAHAIQPDPGEVVEEYRLRRVGHPQERPLRDPADPPGQPRGHAVAHPAPHHVGRQRSVGRSRAPVEQRAGVFAVAGEQFVRALAREHHLHVVARQPRDEVERHARRMRDRLVFVPDQPWERAQEVALVDHDLVAVGLDGARDGPRVIQLAERAVLEGHREGLQRPVDHARHQRRDRAAVDAA